MNALTRELQQIRNTTNPNRDSHRIRIAIQKSGRLQDDSVAWLQGIGLKFQLSNQLTTSCDNAEIDLITLRQSDIPKYIEQNTVDFGILGLNTLLENTPDVQVIKKLGFGICSLVLATPDISNIRNLEQLQGKIIATSYPNSLQRWLNNQNLFAKIITMQGSVEVAPELGIADAICDLTKTGKTLEAHDLSSLTTLYSSEAVLITASQPNTQQTQFMNTYL